MFVQPMLSALKNILNVKIFPIMPISLLFSKIEPDLAQILPQDHTHFEFFASFQWSMLGDSISINNFNWNPVVLKKFC